MPKIIVTGGAGFIGSRFVALLLENDLPGFEDWDVIVIDALTYAGSYQNIVGFEENKRFKFVHGNILDAPVIDDLIRNSDGIINFAAETHVDRSISSPREFIETNYLGVANILQSIHKYSKRYLQISTDEVYGSVLNGYSVESDSLDPSSPYSASKAAADLLVLSYKKTFNSDVVITRCSNNYGPNQFPEKIIPFFIKLLKEGKQVPVYGNGLNTRDWIHVDDHCKAINLVFHHGKSGEIYNVGDVEHLTNLELVEIILNEFSFGKERIEFVQDRLGHDFRYAINSNKIRSELNWTPVLNIRDEIRRLIKI
ncbi:dTDP-glucose 4,6-dehydratase [Candidatus Planktophila lacus]|uniref:dTDP-glucose 4,6-dehydratase n=1 Tax=Candidatus Planktophila lacus TaxID=1884913 RepID=A0AAC9YR55_9ACTN|nr:dTDP-glucose 4,6-dehydratase [Candidatus Planktophila lacus]ASY10033.1 dTDP-glucose 4,6-dehydratase [Candidatus Planktophila lacus]